jgi:hypothetical protein
MQAIALLIPRLRTYSAGDRYSIYGNVGAGLIDYDAPPLAGDVPFWPGTREHAGHLNEPHLGWGHLDHLVQDGHLVGRHMADDHLRPQAVLRFTTPLYYFGEYVLVIRTMDWAGNVSAEPPASVGFTINSSPRPASDFARAGYEATADRIVFSFSPSPDLGP